MVCHIFSIIFRTFPTKLRIQISDFCVVMSERAKIWGNSDDVTISLFEYVISHGKGEGWRKKVPYTIHSNIILYLLSVIATPVRTPDLKFDDSVNINSELTLEKVLFLLDAKVCRECDRDLKEESSMK